MMLQFIAFSSNIYNIALLASITFYDALNLSIKGKTLYIIIYNNCILSNILI